MPKASSQAGMCLLYHTAVQADEARQLESCIAVCAEFTIYRALLKSGGWSSICSALYPPDQDGYSAIRHTAGEGQAHCP